MNPSQQPNQTPGQPLTPDQQPIVQSPQPQPTPFPSATPGNIQAPPTIGAQPPTPNKSPSLKKPLIIGGAILLVIIAAAAVAAVISRSQPKKQEVAKQQEVAKPTYKNFLVYFGADTAAKVPKPELRVSTDGHDLATVPLPDGKTTFVVLSKGSASILVSAVTDVNDAAPIDFLIKQDGKVTQLPASTAKTIQTVSINGGALDSNSNYLYVACQKTECDLTSMSLDTQTPKTIMTTPYTPATVTSTSLLLLGISPDDNAHMLVYQSNRLSDSVGTYTEVSIKDGSTKQSFIMKAPARGLTISSDYSKAVYSPVNNPKAYELMDLKAGSTTQINSDTVSAPASYVWSPDAKKAAFVSSDNGQLSISIVDTVNSSVLQQKSLGAVGQITARVNGWQDDKTIEYQIGTTVYSLNVDNGTTTESPSPRGFVIL